MENKNKLIELLKNKKVLFVATKNKDYIRIAQEIRLIEEHSLAYDVVCYTDRKYWVRFLKVFFNLLFRPIKEYDVVVVSFMPQMLIPLLKRKLKKSILIVDFFISIYDTLVDDRKVVKEKSILSNIVKYLDKSTICAADHIIVDTKAHGYYFSKEFGIAEEKMIPLYLEADVSFYHPMSIEKDEKLKGKLVVLYFGSILPVQGVEVVLETIEQLKNNKNIHFIMIGPISDKYNKVVSDTVSYYDWLSQEELAKKIASADLCLGGHFSATIGKANRTIPGKVYIYQAMGKPVVLGDSDANRELFKQDSKTMFVPRGNSNELKKCIERVYIRKMEENDAE